MNDGPDEQGPGPRRDTPDGNTAATSGRGPGGAAGAGPAAGAAAPAAPAGAGGGPRRDRSGPDGARPEADGGADAAHGAGAGPAPDEDTGKDADEGTDGARTGAGSGTGGAGWDTAVVSDGPGADGSRADGFRADGGAAPAGVAGGGAVHGRAGAAGPEAGSGTGGAGRGPGAMSDGPGTDGSRIDGFRADEPGTAPGTGTGNGAGTGSGAGRPRGVPPRAVGGAEPGREAPGPLAADELVLRRMLRSAVEDIEPADGTLEQLRRAVPARRARRRQALVGAAAVALFLGTAVPALVHVTHSVGADADPSVAGSASRAKDGTGRGTSPAGGQGGIAGSAGATEPGREPSESATAPPKAAEPGATAGETTGAEPSAGTTAPVPACSGADFGPVVASSAEPDSTGAVYGSFRVTNVAAPACVVGGPGSVASVPLGVAEAARVGTARHAAGDAAAGLPDPSLEAASATLERGESYEVRFAWVPSETCPTPGGTTGGSTGAPTGGPTPEPSPSEDTTTGGEGPATGAPAEEGVTPQLFTEEGPAEAGVTVAYVPEGGGESAAVTVDNACAGTVYWTGMLPAG
ncbi:hypothetical protein [Streptomyces sp. SID8352]|uniref:hypothetical protein n=1 Tax=Streptomyces sp. SID8352 TaxID=2690338 RepID=UPI001F25C5D2|nr:hypothetical protein [Streptomyces sp. SID8352]